MRDYIKSAWQALAGGRLPAVAPIKARPKQASIPSHRTQVAASPDLIRRADNRLATSVISEFRAGRTTYEVVRNFAAASADLSAATNSYLRLGIPEMYTCIGRNTDGSYNPEATRVAMELLRRYTNLGNPEFGTFSQQSLQSMSESLGKELLLYGALAGEIVLDRSRLPTGLTPFSTSQIEFRDDDQSIPKSVKPVQVIGGEEIDIDFPTVIIVQLDQSLLTPYSSSFFESAIQPVTADAQFMEDLRRVLKRAAFPRFIITLIEEKIRKTLDPERLNDPEKRAEYYEQVLSEVEATVNGLSPEDALITWDHAEHSFADGGHSDIADLVKAMQDVLNSKTSTGAKTLPVVLGHGGSSQASSTESMLYVCSVDMVRRKLNEFYSRALTVGTRLFGIDCYIEFRYENINLRPQDELEAFRSMYQSRILDQWSLGFIGDEEACIKLTGNLPAVPLALSGTQFRHPQQNDGSENPTSNTSNLVPKNEGPQNRKSQTPEQPKGPAK